MTKAKWPCWMYGPNGESQMFHSADDVPAGWADTPAAFGKSEEPRADDKVPDPDPQALTLPVPEEGRAEALSEVPVPPDGLVEKPAKRAEDQRTRKAGTV